MFLMNIEMYMLLETTHFSDYSWSCEASNPHISRHHTARHQTKARITIYILPCMSKFRLLQALTNWKKPAAFPFHLQLN
jgi:hypothetical protein